MKQYEPFIQNHNNKSRPDYILKLIFLLFYFYTLIEIIIIIIMFFNK